MSEPRIVDLVFARVDPHGWRRAAVALALSGSVALVAVVTIAVTRDQACECGARVPLPLDRSVSMEVPTAAPPPGPTQPVEPVVPRSEPDPTAARQAPVNRAPPSFALAGSILARQAGPNEPMDLTGEAFVTGSGPVFGGGLTTSSGTSSAAVRVAPASSVAARSHAGPRSSVAANRSRPVGLPDPSWTCPWPAGGESEAFDEQSAFVQVTVRPDGSVVSVAVLMDPGYGFGESARRCAMSARFAPALNEEGVAIRAVSPPIRVRFMR